MRLLRLPGFTALALTSALALAACESDEERAQSHYERAVTLVAEGESERAAIELRNALQALVPVNLASVGTAALGLALLLVGLLL